MNPMRPQAGASRGYNPWGRPDREPEDRISDRVYNRSARALEIALPLLRVLVPAVVLGIGIAHGCDADVEGKGNDFEVKGQVVFSNDILTRIKVVEVITANGSAARIDVGETVPFYTQYRDDSCDIQVVGAVSTFATRPNETDDHINVGDFVEVNGTRHDSFRSCGKYPEYGQRNVAEMVATVPA